MDATVPNSRPAPDAGLLVIEEVSARLGVPVETLYKWRERGQGPKSARIGRRLRYRSSDVDTWVESQFPA